MQPELPYPACPLQDRIASLNGKSVDLVLRQDLPGFVRCVVERCGQPARGAGRGMQSRAGQCRACVLRLRSSAAFQQRASGACR